MEQQRIQKLKHRRPPEDEPEIELIIPNHDLGETTVRVVEKIDASLQDL